MGNQKTISIEEADRNVVSALYQKAIGGDTRAIIFWLCNRQPGKWGMKPTEQETDDKEYGVVLMPPRGDHEANETTAG